jgi:hypothetical protein
LEGLFRLEASLYSNVIVDAVWFTSARKTVLPIVCAMLSVQEMLACPSTEVVQAAMKKKKVKQA